MVPLLTSPPLTILLLLVFERLVRVPMISPQRSFLIKSLSLQEVEDYLIDNLFQPIISHLLPLSTADPYVPFESRTSDRPKPRKSSILFVHSGEGCTDELMPVYYSYSHSRGSANCRKLFRSNSPWT